MSDYAQVTQFGPKESLPAGSLARRIKGSEHDVEFSEIRLAIATKADEAENGVSLTGKTANLDIDTLTAETITGFDHLAIVDADDSNATRTDELFDLSTAIATGGVTGITETSGILEVDAEKATLATAAAGDHILIADTSDSGNLKKVPLSDFAALLPESDGGLKAESGVLKLDFTNLPAHVGAIDSPNDQIMRYNPDGINPPNVRKTDIEEVMGDTALFMDADETDDLGDDDTFIFDGNGSIGRMKEQHQGQVILDLPHFRNIFEVDGNKVIINTTGGVALWAMLAHTNYPIGFQFTMVNTSLSDTVAIYPETNDWIVSVVRQGQGTSGAHTVNAGGTARMVLNSASVWSLTGDIS